MVLAEYISAADTSSWVGYVALGVSVLALVASGVTLWRTHLAPMRVLVACGPLTLRITPFRARDERWFVADVKIDLTFTNSGARPGVVRNIRMRADYPGLPISHAREFFELSFEVS